jgi:hypothetical protein
MTYLQEQNQVHINGLCKAKYFERNIAFSRNLWETYQALEA